MPWRTVFVRLELGLEVVIDAFEGIYEYSRTGLLTPTHRADLAAARSGRERWYSSSNSRSFCSLGLMLLEVGLWKIKLCDCGIEELGGFEICRSEFAALVRREKECLGNREALRFRGRWSCRVSEMLYNEHYIF